MVGNLIHPMDAESVDLNRLERSLSLLGESLPDGRYRVSGGAEPHWVDLRTPNFPRCDCGDYLWRESLCKHILAALLREGDQRVIRALGRLVSRLKTGQLLSEN